MLCPIVAVARMPVDEPDQEHATAQVLNTKERMDPAWRTQIARAFAVGLPEELTHVRYPAKCRLKQDIAPRFLIGIVW